jgi:NADPH:quinone reductase-like Zn-dependent oxidoreductase
MKTFPLAQMADAHLQMETGKTRGKIVVVVG